MSTEVNDQQNGIKVRIGENFLSDGVDVYLLRELNPGMRYIMRINREGGWADWDIVEPMETVGATFTLQGDFARALLEALMRHYQGASDMHTVRKDLLHERERRDKLEDHIMFALEMAHRPERPPLGEPR